MIKTLSYIGDHRLDMIFGCVSQSEQQSGLTGMLSQAGNAAEQHGTASDCLQACLRVCQSDIPTPPIVDERDCPRREVATFQVMRGIATPAPLVFQLIEAILTVSPIPV